MEYDYEGVTELRHDKEKSQLILIAKGETHVVEGVKRLFLKGVPWLDDNGVAHMNHGRVSIDGEEAAAGD